MIEFSLAEGVLAEGVLCLSFSYQKNIYIPAF